MSDKEVYCEKIDDYEVKASIKEYLQEEQRKKQIEYDSLLKRLEEEREKQECKQLLFQILWWPLISLGIIFLLIIITCNL